jgi:hypothetical protein
MMWLVVVLAVLSAAFYAYSIAGSVKVSPKAGCSACPKKEVSFT